MVSVFSPASLPTFTKVTPRSEESPLASGAARIHGRNGVASESTSAKGNTTAVRHSDFRNLRREKDNSFWSRFSAHKMSHNSAAPGAQLQACHADSCAAHLWLQARCARLLLRLQGAN